MEAEHERLSRIGESRLRLGGGGCRVTPDARSSPTTLRSPDPVEVAGGPLEPETLDPTLGSTLRAHPDAVVLALDDGASRVPLPGIDRFATCRELPAPGKTVMDFVVPQDRMVVTRCWERARAVGLGTEQVRLSDCSGRDHTLLIIDARARYGVWIEVLTLGAGVPPVAPSASSVRLPPPSRPRTAVIHKNLSAVIVAIDDRAPALLGWMAEEMIGRRSLDFLHPDDHERAVGQWLEMRSRQTSQRVRVRHRRRDDTWLWIEIENEYLGADDPDGVVAVARVTDVSEEMAAVEALRQHEALLRRLAESLPLGIVQVDRDRQVVYANARLGALLGVAASATWSELVGAVEPVGRARLVEAIDLVLTGGPDTHLEATVDLPDGPSPRQCLFTLVGMTGPDRDVSGVLVCITDVTDSVQLREQLQIQATRDPLTGCLNRAATLAALKSALSGADAAHLAVVFLDLDDFKAVNDTAGHAVGDQILHQVGRRLATLAGGERHVGRLGGDEFLVLCFDVADAEAALTLAGRLRDGLSAPMELPAGQFRVHASFGVAFAHSELFADDLVAHADEAMYRAKRLDGAISIATLAGHHSDAADETH